MASEYGFRTGRRMLRDLPVAAASADISVGDLLTLSSGYIAQASAGSTIYGVAASAATSPSSDGGVSVSVDVSEESVYYYPVGTGTIDPATDLLATCDAGGAQSLDVTASADDNLLIVEIDSDNNAAWVRLILTPSGVV